MKINEIFKVVKPTYAYYKIIPNNSVRNQSTYKILRAISSTYSNIFQRVKRDDEKVIKLLGKEFLMGTKYRFESFSKVSYFIHIEKKSISFYFVIPDKYGTMLRERISDVWNGVTILEVDTLPSFEDPLKYSLSYNKEDALSLRVDRRDNELLKSNANIVNMLEDKDKVGIFYNFIPMSQHMWHGDYKMTIDKVNNNQPVDRDKSKISFILKYSLSFIANMVDTILGSISSNTNMSFKEKFNDITLSNATIEKKHDNIISTQVMLFSESNDRLRRHNNMRSLSQSFEVISDDNKLVAKNCKSKLSFDNYKIKGASINKMSDKECQSLVSLAGRGLLEEYNFIDKTNTKETQVPDELHQGIISIGENEFRGHSQLAYLSDDKEYRNLTLMLIGPTRSGKSTFIQNFSKDAIDNDECVIMFDFIKNCELSEEVASVFPSDKVLRIECDDFDKMQGLGYNEVGYESDPFKRYDNAKKQTTQLMTLVNSINHDDVTLSAKMERYLTSAALVVFLSNGSIKDVFDVLQNHIARQSFIDKVPGDQVDNMSEYMFTLGTLDDYDKEGNLVGTKLNLIVGIIDRLNKLKANTYMELMLKKDTNNNVDLSKEIQNNKLICIKMPEDMFSTDGERDIYTTYWTTKLWLALQMRAKRVKDRRKHTKANLIIDEIYQVKNTEKFITEKLSRLAKFSVKPVISCHYINQLKYMRNELRSANASYMLISGCDKNNFNEFKEELHPFEMNDLLNMKRYYCMNIVKYSEGYSKFITKLPGPII